MLRMTHHTDRRRTDERYARLLGYRTLSDLVAKKDRERRAEQMERDFQMEMTRG